MKTEAITLMFLLYLAVPSVVETETCACTASSCLRDALQTELTSTPNNIRNLQNAFYSSKNTQRSVSIRTNMTVSVNITCEPEEVCNSSTSIPPFIWTHAWYEDNFLGIIGELTTGALIATNPVATLLGGSQTLYLLEPGYFTVSTLELNIQVNCVFRSEPNQLEEKMREIWEGILQWVSIVTHIISFGACTIMPGGGGQIYSDSCHMFVFPQNFASKFPHNFTSNQITKI